MPLYSDDGQIFMTDAFDALIQRTAGDNLHPSSQLAQSLMMGAVYYHDFPVQVMQEAAGQIVYFMVLIRVQIAVTVGTGQILDDAAAQPYIDDLHSLADAQNGDAALYAVFQGLQLQDIQFRVDGA